MAVASLLCCHFDRLSDRRRYGYHAAICFDANLRAAGHIQTLQHLPHAILQNILCLLSNGHSVTNSIRFELRHWHRFAHACTRLAG